MSTATKKISEKSFPSLKDKVEPRTPEEIYNCEFLKIPENVEPKYIQKNYNAIEAGNNGVDTEWVPPSNNNEVDKIQSALQNMVYILHIDRA
jgi:hypothetical protein